MSRRLIQCGQAAIMLLAIAPVAGAAQDAPLTPKAEEEQAKQPASAEEAPAQQTRETAASRSLRRQQDPSPRDTPREANFEGMFDDDIAPERPAETTTGFLGQSVWFDALMLLATALAGALIALLSPWSRLTSRLGFHVAHMRNRLERIEAGLKAQANLSTPPSSSGASRYDALDTRRRPPSASAPERAHQFTSEGTAANDAAEATRREEHERNSKMQRALDDYARLVAMKGSKPRQFSQLLAEFPEACAIRLDQGHNLSTEPFREGDANQFVVAVGDGRRFAVLPTYEYISDFSIAFSAPVQNPEHIRQLFEFTADDTGQIRLESPAVVDIEENGAVEVIRRGRLAGFRS